MSEAERVRYLAYKIWESEGRPEGQQQRHWDMALKIVATERVAGTDATLEEVGEPLDEAPILEDELPLEEDEVGIDENRLPLEPPDGEPSFDETPFRDDKMAGTDVPVQDRGHPQQAPPSAEPPPGAMEPLPEDSATVRRTRRPRRSDDTLTPTNETDTTQVPGKTAARTRTRKSDTTAKTTQKPAKTAKKATKTAKATKADQKPKTAKKTKTTKASDPS
ncbi:DUF2934 domain-containing protein [Vreelandella rituensis]|uniref:DUF2934 domain-containing protein n=2 Tax=Vreelandella rituensis TaxID=2282306 RepID=A0A368U822_9GAMM|nr:DUF2934 domain-containing protein [Halomonas rituensis]